MISEYNFEILCHKYNLSKDKIFKKNSSIIKKGKFQEIDDTLNYLINDLNINVRNIEKCPSILYRDVKQIKENINFIKVLRENFEDDTINKIDMDNISKIIMYLKKVYYPKKTRN